MTIYKVVIERVSADWGRHERYEDVGYFSTREKAETVKQKYDNSHYMTVGKDNEIVEIEIDKEILT